MNKIGWILSVGVACALNVQASITIHGSTTAYQESQKDWLSATANDIDSVAGYGTDGFIFFGDASANTVAESGKGFAINIQNSPSYVSSFAQGANFGGVADDFSTYASYDDPIALDGTDTLGGVAVSGAGAVGAYSEVMKFTIAGLEAGRTVRVGILSNVEAGLWDPTSITLSQGAFSATVGNHTASPLPSGQGQTDWVFFDVDADGTYAIGGTQRYSGQGISIAGVTFDSIPEPATAGLISLFGITVLFVRRRLML